MKKLYVGNLPFQSDEEGLRAWFSDAGIQVETITLIRDNYTHQLRGFGFVEIANDDDANRAIQELNGKEFMSRALTVNEARPRREGGGGRGGRGGRGGGGKRPRW